jgi:hypothetical protein
MNDTERYLEAEKDLAELLAVTDIQAATIAALRAALDGLVAAATEFMAAALAERSSWIAAHDKALAEEERQRKAAILLRTALAAAKETP